MESLVVKISNPDTVHAIAEAAKRQGTTPEAAALELLETAVLAQKPFEQIVEPIAQSFDESGMSEEELDDLVEKTQRPSARRDAGTNRRFPGVVFDGNLFVQGIANRNSPARKALRLFVACLKYLTISSTCTSDFRSGKGANSDK